MATLRFEVIGEAFKKRPLEVQTPAERPSEYFAINVFNKEKMARYLSTEVYNKMVDVIDHGAPMERSIANQVADGTPKTHRLQTPTVIRLRDAALGENELAQIGN